MNAIIALCHFCELHGPSVLFCTQAFHSHDPKHVLEKDTEESSTQGNGGSYYVRPRERRLHSEDSVSSSGSEQSASSKKSDLCEGCRSLAQGQSGYICSDHEARVSYVSSQHPDHPQVFSMVRQACVRSLSGEVCQGREGPIFFGEEHRSYVFSYTFYLKDSHARGLQRWYSIIVVMMDKIYLLNSWPFLVKHIRRVIDELQSKANKVYDTEAAHCPPRALRLTSTMPTTFRQQRGASQNARSLTDLTNDKNVFALLHLAFTWILKAGSNRMTEKLLEGPPTEDSIIDMEKQEETEEGFIKLFSKKICIDEGDRKELQVTDEESLPDCPTFKNLRHLYKVLGYTKFHSLAHHIVIGNQVIIRCAKKHLTTSLINSLKALLPKGCCRVIMYSAEYEDSWRCNFLGLPLCTGLPIHRDVLELCVVVDITTSEGASSQLQDEDDFVGYHFELTTWATMSEKGPSILSKMEAAIMNDSLSWEVVEQCLICLKEECMNKVKVLFKFTKAGGSRSEEDTKKLLQTFGAQEEDQQVLKFWMTGLSVQYKNHMLSATMSQSAS